MKFGNWILVLGICLGFGILCFGFTLLGCQSSSPSTQTTTTTVSTTSTSAATTSTTTSTSSTTTTTLAFTLSSSAFTSGEAIPTKYAYTDVTGGQDKSIPLSWTGAPAGTQSFALSIVDISVMNFVHWLMTNIPSSVSSLAENISSSLYTQYSNNTPSLGYDGPYPPPGDPAHIYVITLYALNTSEVTFSNNTNGMNLTAFNNAISGKTLGQAVITGTFSR